MKDNGEAANSIYVWNAAIETVIEIATADYHITAEEIRKLKK